MPAAAGGSVDLPALEPLPAEQIALFDSGDGHDLLAFDSTIANTGAGALAVVGFRRSATAMAAYQLLYRHGRLLGARPAGELVYDDDNGHHHWHYNALARYRLLGAD